MARSNSSTKILGLMARSNSSTRILVMYEAHRAEGVLEGILLEPAPATWRAVATEHNSGL